jgi:hypothetical protein
LPPYFLSVNTHYMSSWRPTHSQYAHRRVVATLRVLIHYYNERGLTHISQVLSYSAIIEGVGYEVHRYITTGALPYEERSEERPWTDEE